jgi:hypothetical protein
MHSPYTLKKLQEALQKSGSRDQVTGRQLQGKCREEPFQGRDIKISLITS